MQFDPKRVAIVDKKGNTLLVRGSAPIYRGCFSYSKLKKAIGLTSEPPKFIVVNLMDNTGERDDWQIDLTYFDVDPNRFLATSWPPYIHAPTWTPDKPISNVKSKAFYWWPIEGMSDDCSVPAAFLNAPGWDFSGCIDLLSTLIDSEVDSLIYFHCRLGADRTGAVHAGYLIKRYSKSVQEALDIASKSTAAGAPSSPYINLVRAYAQKHPSEVCANCPCINKTPPCIECLCMNKGSS